jgi:hypothetical protein
MVTAQPAFSKVCYRRRKAGDWRPQREYRDVRCSGFRIRHPTYPERSVHAGDMLRLLGHERIPEEGIPSVIVDGDGPTGPVKVRIWANSKATAKERGQFQRVRAECPGCKADVPAGRLFSHLCKGT